MARTIDTVGWSQTQVNWISVALETLADAGNLDPSDAEVFAEVERQLSIVAARDAAAGVLDAAGVDE